MAVIDAAFAAAGGATSLALAATLWALTQRRRAVARIRELSAALERYEGRMDAAHASAEAFDSAVVAVEGGRIRLASGRESLIACGIGEQTCLKFVLRTFRHIPLDAHALEEGDDDGGEDDEDEEGGDERGSLRRTRNFEFGMGNEEWDPRLRR